MSQKDCKHIATLLAARRSALSNADRLRLEEHLSGCDACAVEGEMESKLAALLDTAPPVLSSERRQLLIEEALNAAQHRSTHGRRSFFWPAAMGGCLLAAAATMVVVLRQRSADEPEASIAAQSERVDRVKAGRLEIDGQTRMAGEHLLDGQSVRVIEAAELQLAHADVHADSGTVLRWSASRHTVHLQQGALTAQVDPGPQRRFAVATPRFRVVVTGTRFRVDAGGVSVTEGSVRVEGLDGSLLRAAVAAGQHFEFEPAVEDLAAVDAPTPLPVDEVFTLSETTPREVQPSVGRLLSRARKELAQQRVQQAEALISRVLNLPLSESERAEALTLHADSAASAGQLQLATRRYLRVARSYRSTAAGENALYAASRLELEQSRNDAARAHLLRYVESYPNGRFMREAKLALSRLSHAEPSPPSPVP